MSNLTREQIESAALQRWKEELTQCKAQPDHVPVGWFTIEQISSEIGKSTQTTRNYVKKKVKEGSAQRADYRIRLEQHIRPVPHYKLKGH